MLKIYLKRCPTWGGVGVKKNSIYNMGRKFKNFSLCDSVFDFVSGSKLHTRLNIFYFRLLSSNILLRDLINLVISFLPIEFSVLLTIIIVYSNIESIIFFRIYLLNMLHSKTTMTPPLRTVEERKRTLRTQAG